MKSTVLRKAKVMTPPPDQQQREKKRGPFAGLGGQRLTIQSRAGTIYSGRLVEVLAGCLKLDDVLIIGSHHRVKAPWVIVDRNIISHFHPAEDVDVINETQGPKPETNA